MLTKPIKNISAITESNSVKEVLINDQSINDDQDYTIVTIDYVASSLSGQSDSPVNRLVQKTFVDSGISDAKALLDLIKTIQVVREIDFVPKKVFKID